MLRSSGDGGHLLEVKPILQHLAAELQPPVFLWRYDLGRPKNRVHSSGPHQFLGSAAYRPRQDSVNFLLTSCLPYRSSDFSGLSSRQLLSSGLLDDGSLKFRRLRQTFGYVAVVP